MLVRVSGAVRANRSVDFRDLVFEIGQRGLKRRAVGCLLWRQRRSNRLAARLSRATGSAIPAVSRRAPALSPVPTPWVPVFRGCLREQHLLPGHLFTGHPFTGATVAGTG